MPPTAGIALGPAHIYVGKEIKVSDGEGREAQRQETRDISAKIAAKAHRERGVTGETKPSWWYPLCDCLSLSATAILSKRKCFVG